MPEAVPQELEIYQTEEGRSPFSEWIRELKDRIASARIRTRLARLRLGNFGDTNSLGGGLHELRIDHGPGYRVYYGRAGDRIVLLLCGGSKRNQSRDIEQASTGVTTGDGHEQSISPLQGKHARGSQGFG